jgi:DNA-directed RNA polymerase specialized sigma24 family protein
VPNRENGPPIEEPSREITNLLRAWSGGDRAALGRLAERVYPELRRMARRYMKNERQANTLQSTALVHEVYPRLLDVRKVDWRERAQFMPWRRR